ncbi:MAG: hypothetical protein D6719_08390 [Candidatus Dadabacteria bacterium]|nr:MAG: hypothetical protein D6719_08390 [Candidatus Dadabacteria bacterium]
MKKRKSVRTRPKNSEVWVIVALAALLYFAGVINPRGVYHGYGDALAGAARDVSVKKLKLIFAPEGAYEAGDGEYSYPIALDGVIFNNSDRDFKSVEISWSYSFEGQSDSGAYTVFNLPADSSLTISREKVSEVTLPGFTGGIPDFELWISDAEIASDEEDSED